MSVRATAQVKVNATNLVNLPIVLPPSAEQKRIIAKDEFEATIRESKTQAERLLQVALRETLEPREEYSLTA